MDVLDGMQGVGVDMMKQGVIYYQDRPSWCPHQHCWFQFRVTDTMCGGQLTFPDPHDGDFNTHRMCLNGAGENGGVFDLMINKADVGWFRMLFDALFPPEA